MIQIAIELWTAFILASILTLSIIRTGAVGPGRTLFRSLVGTDILFLLVNALRIAVRLELVTLSEPAFLALITASLLCLYGVYELFTYYITYLISLRTKVSRRPARLVIVIYAVELVVFLALHRHIIPGGTEINKPFLFALHMVGSFAMPVCIYLILRYRRFLTPGSMIYLLSFVLVPWIMHLIGWMLDIMSALPLAMSMSVLFLYDFVHINEQRADAERRAELEKLRVSNTLSRIKPHFLYNSMTAIRAVYRADAEKGEQAITQFSEYLRYNMDSLSNDRPIPFMTELEQAKRYLELQKLRFGDELSVEYDLGCTDFSIPTLTLQPLVENAVTHGIRRSESGCGRVTVRTRDYPDRVEVTVIDDGAGFDPGKRPPDDGRSHVGIDNVRERLALVCGGELRIESAPGRGTSAAIILFKGDTEERDDADF